jgi:hypothetical protein
VVSSPWSVVRKSNTEPGAVATGFVLSEMTRIDTDPVATAPGSVLSEMTRIDTDPVATAPGSVLLSTRNYHGLLTTKERP